MLKEHDDERKKTMSTRSKTSYPPVNTAFELYDGYATTSAGPSEGRVEQRLYVRVEGGLSTKATLRLLRALVSKIEMHGLPVMEATDEWSPLDFMPKYGR